MHNIGRLTPNQLLRKKGYSLSSGYLILGNQVEVIAAGEAHIKTVLEQFLKSKNHRNLLLGNADFYQSQNQIGAAYLHQPDSYYEHYWVIFIADSDNRPKPDVEYIVNSDYTHNDLEQKTSVRDRHHQSRYRRPQMATEQ